MKLLFILIILLLLVGCRENRTQRRIDHNNQMIDRILDVMDDNVRLWRDHLRNQHGELFGDSVKVKLDTMEVK